jgi:hypothetical protein
MSVAMSWIHFIRCLEGKMLSADHLRHTVEGTNIGVFQSSHGSGTRSVIKVGTCSIRRIRGKR